MEFKHYIAKQLLGKKLHFKCDCIIPLDHSGVICDYSILNGEILFTVDINGKLITISENHPNLIIEEI